MVDDVLLELLKVWIDDQFFVVSGVYFLCVYFIEFFVFVFVYFWFEFLMYCDFDWDGDWNYEKGYFVECQCWKELLQLGECDLCKVYFVLQYDVDLRFECMMDLLRDMVY